MNKDLVTKYLPYLDIKSGYNFLSTLPHEIQIKFKKEMEIMERILDNFGKFQKKVHQLKIIEKIEIGYWRTIIIDPSKELLIKLRQNNYEITVDEMRSEAAIDPNFKITPGELSNEYHGLKNYDFWTVEIWINCTYPGVDNKVLSTYDEENILIFKSQPENNLEIPYSVLELYVKMGDEIQNYIDGHVGGISGNCNEFQDYFPLWSSKEIIAINCNPDSIYFAQIGYLTNFGRTDSVAIDLKISLNELLKLNNKEQLIKCLSNKLDSFMIGWNDECTLLVDNLLKLIGSSESGHSLTYD